MKKNTYVSNKNSHNQFLFITYIILCVFSFLIVFLSFNITKNDVVNNDNSIIDFSEGWTSRIGEPVDFNYISYDVYASKNLPQIDKDSVLFFRAKNVNVSVYKNDILYKDVAGELLEKSFFYKSPGTYYISIPITREDSYQKISIKISAPYKKDSSCNVSDIYIGDKADIVLMEFTQKLPAVVTCLLIIFLGILFIGFSIPLSKYDNNGNSLLYLGIFSFLIGIWSLLETKVPHLLFGSSIFYHVITGLSLLLFVTPIFLFFKKKHPSATQFPVYIVGVLTILTFILSCLFHFFGIMDLHECIFLSHINIGVSVIFTLYYAVRCFIASKFKDSSFFGLIFIALGSLADLIFYYFGFISDNSTFVRVGVLLYIATLGYQILKDYIDNYNLILKHEFLNKMAYSDILTNLGNRTAFNEDVNIIDKEANKNEKRIIAMFDVNNLKQINDNLGHSVGDKAIIEAAQIIRSTFSDSIGKCYRIGGDEFVFLSNSYINNNDMAELYSKFHEELTKRNKNGAVGSEGDYPIVIAFGYSVIDYSRSIDSSFALKEADAKMYSNKKHLKNTK